MEASQFLSTRHYLYKNKQQLLESRLHNVETHSLQEIRTGDLVKERATFLIRAMADYDVSISVIDAEGNVILQGSKRDASADIPTLSADEYKKLINEKSNSSKNEKGNSIKYAQIKDKDHNEYLALFQKLGPSGSCSGLVQLTTSAESVHSLLALQLFQYIIGSILILVLGVLFGAPVLKSTLKPLFNMTNTVEQITVGELNTRLPENNGQIEIDRLSKAFNDMLEGIEISFEKEQYIKEKMRQFVSDASHELRTPLTSIHGFVEVLLRGAAKNEKQLDLALNSILTESERLTKLVNDLLMLTRLDQQPSINIQLENFKDIIEEVMPQLQIIAGQRLIKLEAAEALYIKADKNQIKQVIFNLFHNAVQHTDEKQGIININLSLINKEKDALVVFKVIDNGTGIPKEDLSEIFDRFFRSESHRSRKHGGYGLGLSIVKSIIDAHEGQIQVDSDLGKGTTFTVYLKEHKII
jgi:two-component system OmpR family sensor kinase